MSPSCRSHFGTRVVRLHTCRDAWVLLLVLALDGQHRSALAGEIEAAHCVEVDLQHRAQEASSRLSCLQRPTSRRS